MAAKLNLDEQLLIDMYKAGKTYKQIAEELGVSKRSIERYGSRLAKRGLIDTINKPGFAVTGESVLIDNNGNVKLKWVKTSQDREKLELIMREAMNAFTEELPRVEPVPTRGKRFKEKLALYPVFDLHIGALAHHAECGDSYDTATAEQTFHDFLNYAVEMCPATKHAVLLIGGDFLHSDGLTPVTPLSGNILDQDSRYAKLVYVAIRNVRHAIKLLLTNHEHVELQIIAGNHDLSGSVWLRSTFAAFYENEPRVSVDVSPAVIHHTQYGRVFLAYHHGHSIKKPETLLQACVSDWREDFGQSVALYAHCGHWHNQKLFESALGNVEYHGTLAAKDAYSTNCGYRSRRQAAVILYDKEQGEFGRFYHYV